MLKFLGVLIVINMSDIFSMICQVSNLSPVKRIVNFDLKLRGKQVLLPNYNKYVYLMNNFVLLNNTRTKIVE